jgi:hypothetical protein
MKSLLLIFAIFGLAGRLVALDSTAGDTIYDSDPHHLWNRLNDTLFDRVAPDGKHFGPDELDILYWQSTTNLLIGPSHEKAIAVMDEFIRSHGEKLISDPLKRALLQRDMWELFDWSAKHIWRPEQIKASRELQPRIATIVRRLALTTNEIAALPDNYALTKGVADLPQGLFQTNGDWLGVGVNDYNPIEIAPAHVHSFDGHSAFCVMLHVPGGRAAALDYLNALRNFARDEHAWVSVTNRFAWVSTNSPHFVLELNTNTPNFPANTEWALGRRMCVIDDAGKIRPTSVVESIQVRRYLDVNQFIPDPRFHTNNVQRMFEFQMDKRHGAKLREVAMSEKGFSFVHFRGKGIDLFEESYRNRSNGPLDSAKLQNETLMTCRECHSSRGIFSVLSYTGFLAGEPGLHPLDLAPIDVAREGAAAVYWKQTRYDWGLLQGLWAKED